MNFIVGGKLGDLIHTLQVVKGMTEEANLYITNDLSYGGDIFSIPLEQTVGELISLQQPYLKSVQILNGPVEGINLNTWRRSPLLYKTNWTSLLKNYYKCPLPNKWIDLSKNNQFEDVIIIHRSLNRHIDFPWRKIIENNRCLFVCSNEKEHLEFPFKVEMYKCSLLEMGIAINSCKLFIGNQSMPLTLASALNIPRLAELYPADENSYIGENMFYISQSSSFLEGIDIIL